MTATSFFPQNVIAVVWDFDKTLSPHYMQRPLFQAYDVDERNFWREVRALPDYYRRAGIHVSPDTCYLGHLLSYVAAGRLPDLSNQRLRELGRQIEFYPGIPEFFGQLASVLEEGELGRSELKIEHYVVSTGLAEMVRGTALAPCLDGIWACEFIEDPALPGYDPAGTPQSRPISQIATFLDHTTKTRALFEINKGVNKEATITVNSTIREDERRVPFRNMIYIADGPSDIPSFSVVRRNGGLAYAVYSGEDQLAQAVELQQGGRVDAFGPADYREGGHTALWLRHQVRRIATRIVQDRRTALKKKVGHDPVHLDE